MPVKKMSRKGKDALFGEGLIIFEIQGPSNFQNRFKKI